MWTLRSLKLLALAVLFAASITGVRAQTPTPQWINFYSSDTTLHGKPVPVGAIVEAYDSDGVVCGSYEVSREGAYGFLACYFDDPNTPGDEGIRPGDVVTFEIDGVPAGDFTVPGSVQNGDRFRVDLAASSKTSASKRTSIFTCRDGYEPNGTHAQALEITGPEGHTFYSWTGGIDQDWARFTARAGWIYQIRAYTDPSFLTDPVLRLYDENEILLAENDNYSRKDAEIWWWNDGPERTLYIQARDAQDRSGVFTTQWK